MTFSKSASSSGQCYETHPGLKIGNYMVYGGSCLTPIVNGGDIYVGLDQGFKPLRSTWPWAKVQEVWYPITDGQPPCDPESFKEMIAWLVEEIVQNGKKVHIGCIGGHGRTGMVLVALSKVIGGHEDAIAYVREHYCKKVIESESQVDFLMMHFGVKTAAPA